MKRAIVVLIVLSLIVSSCATNIGIVSYYPPGNQMYSSVGTLLIRVDTSSSGGARGSMRQKADGIVVEQYGDSVFYVEEPAVQTVTEYIQAAFALDYARSNAFEIVSEESMADYILDVTVDSHFAITTTNALKMLLSILLYIPTFGLSLFLMNVNELTVENIMTVVLSDRKGNEIYSENFDETYSVGYSLVETGYYNPSYIRVGLLKKIVTQSLAAITSTL